MNDQPASDDTQRRGSEPRCIACGSSRVGLSVDEKCRDCGLAIVERLQPNRQQRGIRYRSLHVLCGLPLCDIAIGPTQEEKVGRAYGIVAIGDYASGIIAIGGVARGLIAIGRRAFGGCAVGGVAIGMFTSAGAVAVGGLSVGPLALGGFAKGAIALGVIAEGPIAVGIMARGIVAFGPNVTRLPPGLGDWCLHGIVAVLLPLMVGLVAGILADRAYKQHRE